MTRLAERDWLKHENELLKLKVRTLKQRLQEAKTIFDMVHFMRCSANNLDAKFRQTHSLLRMIPKLRIPAQLSMMDSCAFATTHAVCVPGALLGVDHR